MNVFRATLIAFTILVPLSGCAWEHPEDEAVGSEESAVAADNALAINALAINALSPTALATVQDPGPNGALARQLLSYTVGCALPATQSFSFSWTDVQGAVHAETYPGLLGLAPQWAYGALGRRTSQELVSACLAARVNYFGVPVHLSVRGATSLLSANTTSAELAAYPYVEGAFWGNLFTATPSVSACYDTADVSHSRADQRECATGFLAADGSTQPCGIINLAGPCETQCQGFDACGGYYLGCGGSDDAVTVGLQ